MGKGWTFPGAEVWQGEGAGMGEVLSGVFSGEFEKGVLEKKKWCSCGGMFPIATGGRGSPWKGGGRERDRRFSAYLRAMN